MADFTSYWLPQQVEDNLGEAMFHIADNNFNRVRVGDTVWIVTIRPGTGEFMLCARVPVDEITGQAVADKRLRGNAWKARYHVWCQRQDAEQVRLVSLESVVRTLRFQGSSPRLSRRNGKVYPQQVRRVRELTPETAGLMQGVWGGVPHGNRATDQIRVKRVPDLDDELPVSGKEGRKQWVSHLRRERNRKIVTAKKRRVLADTGRLCCEVCDFDFEAQFGPELAGFCEVHHVVPLAEAGVVRDTDLSDLAVLCANCHRAIHRLGPKMPTITELRAIRRRQSGR
jgi:5-methylcytosine-specific restriction endonuclease McrA